MQSVEGKSWQSGIILDTELGWQWEMVRDAWVAEREHSVRIQATDMTKTTTLELTIEVP